MSGLNSYKSWKDLQKPPNPFFGAMFSKSHRKKKRKRELQPIDNPKERGRSLEPNKDQQAHGIRSISEENSTILKLKHENLKKMILDSESRSLLTDSSLDLKKLALNKTLEKISDSASSVQHSTEVSEEFLNQSKYAQIDKAICSNAINMRKKYLKPSHPDNPKPTSSSRRNRKFVKSPSKLETLPFAPDLKPVGFNAFQVGLFTMENEVAAFFSGSVNEPNRFESLFKNSTCKFVLK